MDISVSGLRVAITAGGSGIGRIIAETFVENGARVHICDIDDSALTATRNQKPSISTTLADVSHASHVDMFMSEAVRNLGGLDVLINNAGISGPTATVEEIDPADWDRTMAVNLNGQFYAARASIPHLKAAGGGSIISLSSNAGLFGCPLRAPYVASKWAVIGLTKTLAMELGTFNIRANALCPGSVAGPRIDRVIEAEASSRKLEPDVVRDIYTKQNSLGVLVSAESVAAMALFLSSPLGAHISGQALGLDGNTETLRG